MNLADAKIIQAGVKADFLSSVLQPGEVYVGILLGKGGQPDVHVILLPGSVTSKTWDQSVAWAKSIGGELPTRREQSLLFANLKEEFEGYWHWSGERRADTPDYAWVQLFSGGYQCDYHKSDRIRARAVRRLIIQ